MACHGLAVPLVVGDHSHGAGHVVDRGVRDRADTWRKGWMVPPAADRQKFGPLDCLHHGPGRALRQHGQLNRHLGEALSPRAEALSQLAVRFLDDFLRDVGADPQGA